jgi:hypothetical protein
MIISVMIPSKKVTTSDPWYANIVNFIVSGYVPPGEDRKKLVYDSRIHLWDDPTYSGSASMDYSDVVCRHRKL